MRKRHRNIRMAIFRISVFFVILCLLAYMAIKLISPGNKSSIPAMEITATPGASSPTAADTVTVVKKDIPTLIDEYIKAHTDAGYFSGSVLVSKGGKILLNKGYGMANYELEVPNTPDTKFRIGSLTKQFTAMAIMQLQEKSLLNVNDPISKYIENYTVGSKVTIHNLLTHTSGIPDYINSDKSFSSDSKLVNTPDMIFNRFRNKPLEFKPGTKTRYSNTGYFLLGLIIEKVSGKSYENYIKENILDPLGMKNTGCAREDILLKDRASGYSIDEGKLVGAEFTDIMNFFGCGDMYSTVNDLYMWDRALYTERLVSKKSIDSIFTNYMDEYGYGWKISDSGSHIYHVGRVNGFYSYIGRYPKEDAVVIILCNNWSVPLGTIYKGVDAIMLGKDYELPKYTEPVDTELK